MGQEGLLVKEQEVKTEGNQQGRSWKSSLSKQEDCLLMKLYRPLGEGETRPDKVRDGQRE